MWISFKSINPLLNLPGLIIRNRNRLMVLQDLLQFFLRPLQQARIA